MDRAAFETLITRMEALAAGNPGAYRRRVFGMAILGYGYLLLVVTVLLALCAILLAGIVYRQVIAVQLLFVIGGPLLLVLRAMWVRLEPPTGERLTASRVPELFRMLENLRSRLATPRIHRVLLTPDFNAGVMQVPRLARVGSPVGRPRARRQLDLSAATDLAATRCCVRAHFPLGRVADYHVLQVVHPAFQRDRVPACPRQRVRS
jgi:hypothetical protein